MKFAPLHSVSKHVCCGEKFKNPWYNSTVSCFPLFVGKVVVLTRHECNEMGYQSGGKAIAVFNLRSSMFSVTFSNGFRKFCSILVDLGLRDTKLEI